MNNVCLKTALMMEKEHTFFFVGIEKGSKLKCYICKTEKDFRYDNPSCAVFEPRPDSNLIAYCL